MDSVQEPKDFESYVSGKLAPKVSGSPGISVLVLTCMDYRYTNRIVATMDARELRGKYDQLILGGAGYGVVHSPAWRTTFADQLKFAIAHHGVSELLILDHRDCGMYREFLGTNPDDPVDEKREHIKQCTIAIGMIRESVPELRGSIDCLLLPNETVDELVNG